MVDKCRPLDSDVTSDWRTVFCKLRFVVQINKRMRVSGKLPVETLNISLRSGKTTGRALGRSISKCLETNRWNSKSRLTAPLWSRHLLYCVSSLTIVYSYIVLRTTLFLTGSTIAQSLYRHETGIRLDIKVNFCFRKHVDKVHSSANFRPNRRRSSPSFESSTLGNSYVITSQTATDRTNMAIANQ